MFLIGKNSNIEYDTRIRFDINQLKRYHSFKISEIFMKK